MVEERKRERERFIFRRLSPVVGSMSLRLRGVYLAGRRPFYLWYNALNIVKRSVGFMQTKNGWVWNWKSCKSIGRKSSREISWFGVVLCMAAGIILCLAAGACERNWNLVIPSRIWSVPTLIDLINDRPLWTWSTWSPSRQIHLRQIPWKCFPDDIQRYCFYSVSCITSTETDSSALCIYFDIVKLFLESSNPDTEMSSQSSNKRSGRPQLHSRSLPHSSRSSLKLPPGRGVYSDRRRFAS